MIITIVMEITTMLNDLVHCPEFSLGLITGGLSSIVVTFVSWFITTRLLAPHLQISRDIAFEKVEEEREQKDENGQMIIKSYKAYVYRIKLANNSIRGAFDIRIYFRLRYDNHYATIELPYQPYLKNRKNIISTWIAQLKGMEKKTYEHHRTIPFRLTDIRLSKIEGYNHPELKQKYADGTLNLSDFKKEDTVIEFVVMAFDNISGSALRIVSKKYTQKEIDKHVIEGKFLDGEMYICSTTKTSDG